MKRRTQSPGVPVLRGRIWVELAGKAALTDAGADLLDQIAVCGSLSEAARRLRYSYRRAWMLLHSMNQAWAQPLVTTATGGHRGGGASVTELGHRVLRGYRDVQLQMEHLLGRVDTADFQLPMTIRESPPKSDLEKRNRKR